MKIYGHKEVLDFLESISNSNKIPHTILFFGQLGIGKKKVAINFAKMLNCKGSASLNKAPTASSSGSGGSLNIDNDDGLDMFGGSSQEIQDDSLDMFGGASSSSAAEEDMFGGASEIKEEVAATDASSETTEDKTHSEKKPCGVCDSCTKIDRGMHPDVFVIEPENEVHKIDTFREIKNSAYIAPIDGKYRVTIINDAHYMNINAANSILKLLEEPPPYNIFILITNDRGNLLRTINSRCFPIRFSPPTVEEVENVLKDLEIEKNYLISTRSPGLVMLSSSDTSTEKRKVLINGALKLINKDINPSIVAEMFDVLSLDDAAYSGFYIDIIVSLLRDIALFSNNQNAEAIEIQNIDFENDIKRLIIENINDLNDTTNKLIDLKTLLESNLNKKLFATNVINTLMGV